LSIDHHIIPGDIRENREKSPTSATSTMTPEANDLGPKSHPPSMLTTKPTRTRGWCAYGHQL